MITATGFSQGVQRRVLVEQFTNASCQPCADNNPAFDAFLEQNADKVAVLKYATNYPGPDPLNQQTSSNVSPRVSYYSGPALPTAFGDGNYFSGNLWEWTQSTIDDRYNDLSPFSMSTTHTFSADLDSIFITVVIDPADEVNASSPGKLKLRIAMIESMIEFEDPPTFTGETIFFNIMRTMYPNASGTTLQDAWSVGMPQTFTFASAIPSYIYHKTEIAVVSFIQDDGTKEVLQSSFSPQITFAIDTEAGALIGPSIICQTTTNATLTLKNIGLNTMTACNLDISLDGNFELTQPWTGSLATNESTTITLNNIPVTSGVHTLSVKCTQPGEVNNDNDTASTTISVSNAPLLPPIEEGFEATTYPPLNWLVENTDGSLGSFLRSTEAGGFGQSSSSVYIDYIFDFPGTVDNLYLPQLNLSNALTAQFTMSHAYAQFLSNLDNDAINIQYSTDCGSTWNTIWSKSGAALATAPPIYIDLFVPSADQWVKDTASLNDACGQSSVMIRLNSVSGFGNRAYFDDINVEVQSEVGIEEIRNITDFSIYPNLTNTVAIVHFNLTQAADVTVEVFNSNGQSVYVSTQGKINAGAQVATINTQHFAAGLYIVNVRANGQSISQLLDVTK